MRFASTLLFLLTLLPRLSAQADDDAMVVATRHALRSEVHGEERTVWVHLPDHYDAEGEQRFAVVFLLDGEEHMLHTAGIARFLSRNGLMPEVIIVGIQNTNRMRDMTPSKDEKVPFPDQGGADDFLKFICGELSPWVDARYRTRPTRFLIGHSLGGLVALHALRTRPGFFAGMIAISPSMQWDEQDEVGRIQQWLETDPQVECALYMTAANENGLVGSTQRTAGLFDCRPPAGLRWKFLHMPEETHTSVPHRSTYDGFLFLFDGWNLSNPAQAFLDSDWPTMLRQVTRARARFGYALESSNRMALDAMFQLVTAPKDVAAAERLVEQSGIAEGDLAPQVASMIAGFLGSEIASKGDAQHQQAIRKLSVAFQRLAARRNPWFEAPRKALAEAGIGVEPAEEHDVPAEKLAHYVGVYVAGHETMRIELEEGHLACVQDDGSKQRLFAKAPAEFWARNGSGFLFHQSAKDGGWRFEYVSPDEGRVFRRTTDR